MRKKYNLINLKAIREDIRENFLEDIASLGGILLVGYLICAAIAYIFY